MYTKISNFFTRIIILMLCFFCFNMTIYAHEHSNGCYTTISESHTHKGDMNSGGECYANPIYHTHTNDCYMQCSSPDIKNIRGEIISKENCSNPDCSSNTQSIYMFSEPPKRVYKVTCPYCKITGTYSCCISCDATSGNWNEGHKQVLICKENTSSPIYYELTCTIATEEKQELICNTSILSIVPKYDTQYKTLNKTLVITYLDEHTEEVQATSTSFKSSENYNGEYIILEYNGHNSYVLFYSNENDTTIDTNSNFNNDINELNQNGNTNISITNNNSSNNATNTTISSNVQVDVNEEEINNEHNGSSRVEIENTIIMDIEKEIVYEDTNKISTNKSPIWIVAIIVSVLTTILIVFIQKKCRRK